MTPTNDEPLDHCPQLRRIWVNESERRNARSDRIVEHAGEHGCSPRMAAFYVAELQLLTANDRAGFDEALDRCVRFAEAMPDLRFFVVEDSLRVLLETIEPTSSGIAEHVWTRQVELRRRWSTLPCRRHLAGATTLGETD